MVSSDVIEEYRKQQENNTLYEYRDGELVGGRERERQDAEAEERSRLNNLFSTQGISAKVGPLDFISEFSDPDVDITSDRDRREHDVVSGASEFGVDSGFVVQPKGRRPTNIEISGWVSEKQLEVIDRLTATQLVGVRTGRWTGTAVIEEASTTDADNYDQDYGELFETTISLIGVKRGRLPRGFGESGYEGPSWENAKGQQIQSGLYQLANDLTVEPGIDALFQARDVSCVIGDLGFIDDFSDPNVDVAHSRDTQDHEIVTGHTRYRDEDIDHVTQTLGRNVPEITVDGYIREDQLETADRLTELGKTPMLSGRWSGTVLPISVDVPYVREQHNVHGNVFAVTIELLGIEKDVLPDKLPETN